MKILRTILAFSSMFLAFSSLGVQRLSYFYADQSEVVTEFISLLNNAPSKEVGESISYPSTFTEQELSKDQEGVAAFHQVMIDNYGTMSELKAAPPGVKFYEIGVSGGSGYWWTKVPGVVTKGYIFSVNYSKLGEGFIKVFTSNYDGVENIVAFDYCLPVSAQQSKIKTVNVMHQVLDSVGIPRDHPYRITMADNLVIGGSSPQIITK